MMPVLRSIPVRVVGLALLIGSAAWLYASLVGSPRSHLAAIREDIAALQIATVDHDFAAELEELRERNRRYRGSASIQAEVADILHKVATDLEMLGIGDASITTETTTVAGHVQCVPLNLTFQGSFANVFDLASRLNGYDRVVRVERLVITRDMARPSDGLSVSMAIDAFARAPGEVP